MVSLTKAGDKGMKLLTINKGKTIPQEKLDHIFEQFFRIDSSRNSESGGLGISKNLSLTIWHNTDCGGEIFYGLTGNTDMNPLAIATRAEAEGFYVEGNGSSWNIMDILPEELGLEVYSCYFWQRTYKEGIK